MKGEDEVAEENEPHDENARGRIVFHRNEATADDVDKEEARSVVDVVVR